MCTPSSTSRRARSSGRSPRGQITDTSYPASMSARHSSQTRRSSGTGRFWTITRTRGAPEVGGMRVLSGLAGDMMAGSVRRGRTIFVRARDDDWMALRPRVLPTFLVIGAMKAGTTSLYDYLRAHPQVFMANPKEL